MLAFPVARLTAAAFIALAVSCPLAATAAVTDTNECDIQAANPGDIDRLAPGAPMDSIVPRRAVEACEKAVADYPDEPRFFYQLGRAYQASNRMEQATQAYQRAADLGYPMAFYNLGIRAKERGDTAAAIAYQKEASARGVKQAETELAGLIFTGDGFSSPAFFQAVYDGTLNGSRNSAIYAAEFVGLFNNTPGCQQVATYGILNRLVQVAKGAFLGEMINALGNAPRDGTFEGAARGGMQAGQQLAQSFALRADKAQSDANLFYTRYDCNTPIARQFFKNLGNWAFSF